eukprot:3265358-Amphidinium_carterae.1
MGETQTTCSGSHCHAPLELAQQHSAQTLCASYHPTHMGRSHKASTSALASHQIIHATSGKGGIGQRAALRKNASSVYSVENMALSIIACGIVQHGSVTGMIVAPMPYSLGQPHSQPMLAVLCWLASWGCSCGTCLRLGRRGCTAIVLIR